ncbi:hypothetical protein ScPMuIL_000261 [Solemya velum]
MPRSFLIKKRDMDLGDIPPLEVGIQTGLCVHDQLKEEGTGKRDTAPGDSSEDENREPDERPPQEIDRGVPNKRKRNDILTTLPESAVALVDRQPKVPRLHGGEVHLERSRLTSPQEPPKMLEPPFWQNPLYPYFPPHYPYFPMNFPFPGYPAHPLATDKLHMRPFLDYRSYNGNIPFMPPSHFLPGSPLGFSPPIKKIPGTERVVEKESELSFGSVLSKLPEPSESSSIDLTEKKKSREDVSRYQCDGCKKSYSTYSGLCKHKQFHCALDAKKEFSCKYCDKTYVSLGALKMHIRTHTLPCKCKLCGKAFSRPWLLQGHLRTHTGEKPYRCEQCGRAFADRSNLRAHLQTHSEVKKYSCKTCNKTFSRMSLLLKHEDNCLVVV